jgi:hypothetical protein
MLLIGSAVAAFVRGTTNTCYLDLQSSSRLADAFADIALAATEQRGGCATVRGMDFCCLVYALNTHPINRGE